MIEYRDFVKLKKACLLLESKTTCFNVYFRWHFNGEQLDNSIFAEYQGTYPEVVMEHFYHGTMIEHDTREGVY